MRRSFYFLAADARICAIIITGKNYLIPKVIAVRGGTDGCRLSYMGLPCPNLGIGGAYYHSVNECISIERMDKAVQVLIKIIKIYANWK
jgi:tripeptide aminopeptidase